MATSYSHGGDRDGDIRPIAQQERPTVGAQVAVLWLYPLAPGAHFGVVGEVASLTGGLEAGVDGPEDAVEAVAHRLLVAL